MPDQLFERQIAGEAVVYMHPFFFENASYNRVVYLLTAAAQHYAPIVWDARRLPKRFASFANANKPVHEFLVAHGTPRPTPYFLLPSNSKGLGADTPRTMMSIYKELRLAHYPKLQRRGQPLGGRWSLDTANRRTARELEDDGPARRAAEHAMAFDAKLKTLLAKSPARAWAVQETSRRFPNLSGGNGGLYPADRRAALACLREFVSRRLQFFSYQDAMHDYGAFPHSQLSMALNVGLLTPMDVVRATQLAPRSEAGLAALEGFVRQILGWREYVQHRYLSCELVPGPDWPNPFGNHVALPRSWYEGGRERTGIKSLDLVLDDVWRTGYTHHINRLMLLGCFCMLSEFDPYAVYLWFLTMFVDAHEWVMVFNVFGMSQSTGLTVRGVTRACGMTGRKPYLCGSAYLKRMGLRLKPADARRWDALYRQFLRRKRIPLSSTIYAKK